MPIFAGSASLLALSLVLAAAPGSDAAISEVFVSQLRRAAVRELAAGKLLVAARNLPDPNFATTVVLLAELNPQGAMGLIVNRPTKVTLASILPDLAPARASQATAFFGGPVSVSSVLALLRSKDARTDSRHVVGDVYLVSSGEALKASIAAGAGADRFRVFVGYAGWGAGQLERETAHGAWHVLDADGETVFDRDSDSTWRRQIQRAEALSARGIHQDRQRVPPVRLLADAKAEFLNVKANFLRHEVKRPTSFGS